MARGALLFGLAVTAAAFMPNLWLAAIGAGLLGRRLRAVPHRADPTHAADGLLPADEPQAVAVSERGRP